MGWKRALTWLVAAGLLVTGVLRAAAAFDTEPWWARVVGLVVWLGVVAAAVVMTQPSFTRMLQTFGGWWLTGALALGLVINWFGSDEAWAFGQGMVTGGAWVLLGATVQERRAQKRRQADG